MVYMNRVSLLLSLCLLPLSGFCQVRPADGSTVNYRLVPFAFKGEKAQKYVLEVAIGNHSTEDSFRKHICATVPVVDSQALVELPYFNCAYTWRRKPKAPTAKKGGEGFHYFSTGYFANLDTTVSRLRVVQQSEKYKNSYLLVDGGKAMYSMAGMPVWYLPPIDGIDNRSAIVRDLKATKAGTITLLINDHAYEIDYDGKVLWKAPDTLANGEEGQLLYHHELTRLDNGNYLVLGTENIDWPHKMPALQSRALPPAGVDSTKPRQQQPPAKVPFGTVLLYNKTGKLVWSWQSSAYFLQSDLKYYVASAGLKAVEPHQNSCYFDERQQAVYLGFRNISRIVKVAYPSGKVLAVYGEEYKEGQPAAGNGLFCHQHSCRKTSNGRLYLYNNNTCGDIDALPTIVMLQEDTTAQWGVKKVWEYNCDATQVVANPRTRVRDERARFLQERKLAHRPDRLSDAGHTTGGNVQELPDQSLFVAMDAKYGKLMIVSPDKKVLWCALPERYVLDEEKWFVAPQQYRSTVVGAPELKKLTGVR